MATDFQSSAQSLNTISYLPSALTMDDSNTSPPYKLPWDYWDTVPTGITAGAGLEDGSPPPPAGVPENLYLYYSA